MIDNKETEVVMGGNSIVENKIMKASFVNWPAGVPAENSGRDRWINIRAWEVLKGGVMKVSCCDGKTIYTSVNNTIITELNK